MKPEWTLDPSGSQGPDTVGWAGPTLGPSMPEGRPPKGQGPREMTPPRGPVAGSSPEAAKDDGPLALAKRHKWLLLALAAGLGYLAWRAS